MSRRSGHYSWPRFPSVRVMMGGRMERPSPIPLFRGEETPKTCSSFFSECRPPRSVTDTSTGRSRFRSDEQLALRESNRPSASAGIQHQVKQYLVKLTRSAVTDGEILGDGISRLRFDMRSLRISFRRSRSHFVQDQHHRLCPLFLVADAAVGYFASALSRLECHEDLCVPVRSEDPRARNRWAA